MVFWPIWALAPVAAAADLAGLAMGEFTRAESFGMSDASAAVGCTIPADGMPLLASWGALTRAFGDWCSSGLDFIES